MILWDVYWYSSCERRWIRDGLWESCEDAHHWANWNLHPDVIRAVRIVRNRKGEVIFHDE